MFNYNKTILLLQVLYILVSIRRATAADAESSGGENSTTNSRSSSSPSSLSLSLITSITLSTSSTSSSSSSSSPSSTTTSDTRNTNISRVTLAPVAVTSVSTTTTTSSTSQSSRNGSSTETSLFSPQTDEDLQDSNLFKLVFTMGTDDSYYNARFQFGQINEQNQDNDENDENDDKDNDKGNTSDTASLQKMGLRLDLLQPEIWLMNKNDFVPCSSLYSFISSEEAQYQTGASLPASLTTQSEFTMNCAKRGTYSSTSLDAMPLARGGDASVYNGKPYMIPYLNQIRASGEYITDEMSFNITNGMQYLMGNMTVLLANETNMYVGGLGLALHPHGLGFLPQLVQQGIIKSPGYSLWFNNYSAVENTFAQLIPGVVDTKYYIGDLYQFDMLPHLGQRYAENPQVDADLAALTLPVINLDDIRVERLDLDESLSIKSDDEALPVVLDSRIIYSYLPLDVIVNLAVQANAYYSPEAGRWLVECDQLTNGNATIVFQMGANLSIHIPIREFMADAIYQDKLLKFESGASACYLTVLSSQDSGFNALGLPFLRHIYLVVDNEGKTIAMAETNKFLDVELDDLMHDDENYEAFNSSLVLDPIITPSDTSSTSMVSSSRLSSSSLSSSSSSSSRSSSSSSSIAYIISGTIPFATPSTYMHPNGTFTYSEVRTNASYETVILDIPARLSGAVISEGSIYVTGYTAGSISVTTQQTLLTMTKLSGANKIANTVERMRLITRPDLGGMMTAVLAVLMLGFILVL
ncbi:hypothetical protein LELG_05098 [Lodderomyces elongisporus NRRL YB-4239]|uniref:Peptidase A1 domain-containing protein n=1 Tax=Lodderomyces elongisporus (strain ATCC 11503 / CBS 2605 / JCM 1781 / NBRC 1676 / NRRL YB-4239) TaxID=379508 RepID=A5E659_LODEL|nr:hypothetical protein LELG_05098 [Lodderomyces elongisporus NRRL YB-4239]